MKDSVEQWTEATVEFQECGDVVTAAIDEEYVQISRTGFDVAL
jgi:hypothetical protein